MADTVDFKKEPVNTMTDEEADASIKDSLSRILASQKDMLKLLFDFTEPGTLEEYKKLEKDLEEPMTKKQAGGTRRRRSRTKHRRHTRKF